MAKSQSWKVTPSLETIQEAMSEVDDPSKVILHLYFRQPYMLDEASGLRDAGGIIAGFGMGDTALFDILSGKVSPQGRLPFALAGTSPAIREQYSDLPGYKETTDGELHRSGSASATDTYSYRHCTTTAPGITRAQSSCPHSASS
jgi:beta-glucosidase